MSDIVLMACVITASVVATAGTLLGYSLGRKHERQSWVEFMTAILQHQGEIVAKRARQSHGSRKHPRRISRDEVEKFAHG